MSMYEQTADVAVTVRPRTEGLTAIEHRLARNEKYPALGPEVTVAIGRSYDGVHLVVTDPDWLDRLAKVVQHAADDLRDAITDREADADVRNRVPA